jgi:four helix bundle protein
MRCESSTFTLLCLKLLRPQVIGKQVLRSGTSIGAHYREANRAKSNADFINKIQTALQELEETSYWLELLAEAKIFNEQKLAPLSDETKELNAIFTTIVKKVKSKPDKKK